MTYNNDTQYNQKEMDKLGEYHQKNTVSIAPKAVDSLRFNHGIKYNQINLQYKTIMKINNGEEVRHSSMRKFYDLYNKYYPMDYLEFLEED